MKAFDEFIERRFCQPKRKAYCLISIHEHLPPPARKQLKEVGWAKGLELAKVARRDGRIALQLCNLEMPRHQFRRGVEKELN